MLPGFLEARRLWEGSVKAFVGLLFAAWDMERMGVVVRSVGRRADNGERIAPRAIVVRSIVARTFRRWLRASLSSPYRTNTIA
jgi:hypothetical protein